MNLVKNKAEAKFPRPLALTLGAIFSVMLALNALFPLMSDDYLFSFVWQSETGSMYSLPLDAPAKRIENIGEIFASLKEMYLHWGGRLVGWGLTYLFAFIPDFLFDALNALIFTVFITLITMLGTGKFSPKEIDPRLTALSFLLLWATSSMFANVYLWLCGSAVYLWPATAQLAFLYGYVRFYWRKNGKTPAVPLPLISLLGLLAGWSNENSGAVTILLVLLLCRDFKRQDSLKTWHVCGLVGALVGYGALMLAPGNFEKLSMTVGAQQALALLPYQRMNAIMGIVNCFPMIWAFLRLREMQGAEQQKAKRLAGCFATAGIINTVMMLPLPEIPLRSLTATVYFWLIGALIVWNADKTIWQRGLVRRLTVVYLSFSVLTMAAFMYAMGAYLLPQDRERDELARQNPGADLIIPPYHGPNALMNLAVAKGYRIDVGTVAQKKYVWVNVMYAKYWHLKSVMREENFVAD